MDKQTITDRKAQLKQQFDMAVSNANALQGAIQQCDWVIAQYEAEETKASAAVVDAAVAASVPAPTQP